jgi:predicted HAD superfamily Cof-like phosphohydrolase
MTPQQMTVQFNTEITGYPLPDRPVQRLDTTWVPTLNAVVMEELGETIAAASQNDIVEVADGLGDLVYFIYGMAAKAGIDLDPIVEEIHRSNMTKKGGSKPGRDIPFDAYKDDDYSPPQIQEVLFGD